MSQNIESSERIYLSVFYLFIYLFIYFSIYPYISVYNLFIRERKILPECYLSKTAQLPNDIPDIPRKFQGSLAIIPSSPHLYCRRVPASILLSVSEPQPWPRLMGGGQQTWPLALTERGGRGRNRLGRGVDRLVSESYSPARGPLGRSENVAGS